MMTREEEHIAIRKAVAADAELLADLGAEAFSAAFAPANDPQDMAQYIESSFSPEIQAAELADPASTFLIAEVEREVVGYARLLLGEAPAAVGGTRQIEIVRIYAHPAWIGRGVGSRLMQACLAIAEELDCDTLWLGVWRKNKRAIGFYRTWGFEQVGTQSFVLGRDLQTDLLMERALSGSSSS